MVRIEHPISESLIQNEKNEKREKISLEIAGKYTQINVEGHVYTNNKYREIKDSLSGDESSGGSSSEDNIVITRRTREVTYKKFSGTLRIFSLLLGLCMCAFGCHTMWNTNLFSVMVQQNLILKNNSLRYEGWYKVPVHANLRIYLFNYTNIEEYESGDDSKLKVREVGPYTYVETLERVNVKFNDNGTLTYQDKKTYKFSKELSVGSEMDNVIVPNMPFISTVALAKDYNMLVRMGLSGIFNHMKARPFIQLPIGEFLWGYEEELSRLASKVLAIQYDIPFDKFGIMAAKNGTQNDIITVHTGERDLSKIGVISRYNGEDSLDFWGSQECNRIDGTDGSIYPPSIINPNSTLYLYTKDMCRRIPLEYEAEYHDKHGIPILRFHLPRNIFEDGQKEPKNQCFCTDASGCMPSGVFNASPCAFGAPVVTSLPHFLYGDPILSEDFDGLRPEKDIHEAFVEVDPKMGVPVGGKSRLQLNIMLHQTTFISALSNKYKDGLILPIAWMDYGVDRLPDDVSSMIWNLIFLIGAVEGILSYGFILLSIITSYLLVKNIVQRSRKQMYLENLKSSSAKIPLVLSKVKS